jgi:hypothetical protein
MSANAQRFQNDFIRTPSHQRAALVQKVVSQNQTNTGITNLFANIDLNYQKSTNLVLEEQNKRKADNIFFICKMLNAFPDFQYS